MFDRIVAKWLVTGSDDDDDDDDDDLTPELVSILNELPEKSAKDLTPFDYRQSFAIQASLHKHLDKVFEFPVTKVTQKTTSFKKLFTS